MKYLESERNKESEVLPKPSLISKIGRRLSLRTKKHHHNQTTSPTYEPLGSTTSLERGSSLRRRRTIGHVMGKLFRRKSMLAGLEVEAPEPRPRRVSSFFFDGREDPEREASEEAAVPQRRNSCIALNRESGGGFFQIRKRVGISTNDITRLYKSKVFDPQTVVVKRWLTSARCVLLLDEQLFQGTLTVTSLNVQFQATSLPNKLSFTLRYVDLVAIYPSVYYTSHAINIATSRQMLRFVNMPDRDETLDEILKQWILHCRMMLLDGQFPEKDICNASINIWKKKGVFDDLEPNSKLRIISRAKKITSMRENELEGGSGRPCGCVHHYATKVAERRLPGTPQSLALIIFGGEAGATEKSFGSEYFAEYEGFKLSDVRWTTDSKTGHRCRTIKLEMPHPIEANKYLIYLNEQRIIRDEENVLKMEANLMPVSRSQGQHRLRLRWCFTRCLEEEWLTRTNVLICAEVEPIEGESLDTLAADWILRAAAGGFSDLLEKLDEKLLEDENKRDMGPIKERSLTTMGVIQDFLRQLCLFYLDPLKRRIFPSQRRFRLYLIYLSTMFLLVMVVLNLDRFIKRTTKGNIVMDLGQTIKLSTENVDKNELHLLSQQIAELNETLKSLL